MKKIALFLALVMMMAAFAGCTGNNNANDETTTAPTETTAPTAAAPEGTTEELIAKIYENVTVELGLMSMTLDLTDLETLTWLTSLESAEGLVDVTINEPMMGSQAYSMVLVRCEDGEKAAEVAQSMYDNIDMAKWICVQATEKQAVVCGDLAFFVMLDPQYGVTTDQIVEAFTTVCGGAVDTVIK